jgi:hypothetical protein
MRVIFFYIGRYSVGHEVIHKNDSIYNELPDLIADEDSEIDQHETYH